MTIGPFTSVGDRERAALKELSRLVTEFPSAGIYWVNLKGNLPPKDNILFYKRISSFGPKGPQSGIICFNYLLVEQSLPNRYPLAYQGVTDEAIRSHARKSHRFEDVLRAATPTVIPLLPER